MNTIDELVLINKNTLESLEEGDAVKIVERFVKTGMEVLSADFGFMFWKLENQNAYQVIYTSPETPYKPKLPRKKGFNHKAMVKKAPLFITNPPRYLLAYMKSFVTIPIFYKNHQYGNIVLCFKKNRSFLEEEKTLIMTLSHSAAQVLTIHRTHKKAEKTSNKLLRQKDEFFNMVSHELKTPATTIKGFSQILGGKIDKESKDAKHLLDKINKQADKLSRLINDLLDVSRFQTGQVIFQKKEVELRGLIKHLIESLKVVINSHPISFKSDGQIWVHGDSERIEGVIVNLITNAAKYSPAGSKIKICMTVKKEMAHIEVEDFGYGIPKKDRARIFNRFFRSKDSNKMNSPGLGLGLYIADSIVKHHGGTLNLKPKKNSKGIIFYFTLPYFKYKMDKKT